MDQSQVTTITLEPPQIRRNFHNQSNLWSVIWRSRMSQSANQSHVGLGDWWRTYHSSPTGRAPDTRGHRHDLPQTSSQPYYHTPGRLVICDMPYTGADITNATFHAESRHKHGGHQLLDQQQSYLFVHSVEHLGSLRASSALVDTCADRHQ